MALPSEQYYRRINTIPLLAGAVYDHTPTSADISRIIEAVTITRVIFDIVGWRINYQKRDIYSPMTISYFVQTDPKSSLEDVYNAWSGVAPLLQQAMVQLERQSLAGEMHDHSALSLSNKKQMKRVTTAVQRRFADLEDLFEDVKRIIEQEAA